MMSLPSEWGTLSNGEAARIQAELSEAKRIQAKLDDLGAAARLKAEVSRELDGLAPLVARIATVAPLHARAMQHHLDALRALVGEP